MKDPKKIPDDDSLTLKEPEAAYLPRQTNSSMQTQSYYPSNTLNRPVALLGLSFTKPYNEVTNEFDFIDCIRTGLPKKALDHLQTVTGFTNLEMAQIVHTSDRTLRRYSAKQKLDAEQSERVLELAKLYSRGEGIFVTLDKFKTWMDRELMSLGGIKPKSFLDTSLGIKMLMDELGRIEHGVFA